MKCNVPTIVLDRVLRNHEAEALSIPPPPIRMRSQMVLHPTHPDIPIIVHSSGSTAYPKPGEFRRALKFITLSNKSVQCDGPQLAF